MSITAGPDIIETNLFLYLDAKNTRSYSGTGSTWTDLSGNGRNAAKGGSQSPTYPQWNSAGYFTFSGGTSGDNYSRFDVASIPSFSSLSIFAWYRTSQTTSNKTILRMNNSDFELSVNLATQLYITAGTNWNDVQVTPTMANATNGQWHNIGLTFNGSTLKAYFDGAFVTSTTRASPTTTAAGTLRIGTRDDAFSHHMEGDIATIIGYSSVLSDAEIYRNYNAFRSRYGI